MRPIAVVVFAAYTAVVDHICVTTILASSSEALWFDGLIMTILYRNMILLLCIRVRYTIMCGIIIFHIFVTTNFKI